MLPAGHLASLVPGQGLIREWGLEACWRWKEWPDREVVFPGSSPADDGIDAVGARRSDHGLVAIQCKTRKPPDRQPGPQAGIVGNDSCVIFALSEFAARDSEHDEPENTQR